MTKIMKTIKNPRRTAKLLRATAAAWYDVERDPLGDQFSSGICYAMKSQSLSEGDRHHIADDAWDAVRAILKLAEDKWAEDYDRVWLSSIGRCFDQRAMMCLFMAEWLETDYIGKT